MIEPIKFECENQTIIGTLHLAKENSPIAIICHGWAANRMFPYFLVKASFELAKNNISVLRFDFRGSGESEGEWEKQTITSMIKDLKAAIDFLEDYKKVNINKIAVIGHSQGAYVAFLAAARDKRIKCLTSWMGKLSDLKDFLSKSRWKEYERRGYLEFMGIKISKEYIEDSLKYSLKRDVKKIKVPSLFIYGEKDDWVYPADYFEVYKKLNAPKKLVILKNLDHHFNGKDSKKVIVETLKWTKKWLK